MSIKPHSNLKKCYQRLEDASGFNTDPYQADLEAAACALPLTTAKVVGLIITELAVFAYPNGQLTLLELMPGASREEVRAKTGARFVEKQS